MLRGLRPPDAAETRKRKEDEANIMNSLRKGLGGLMLLVGLATLFNYYFFINASYAGQTVWDIIDPIIIVTLAASIALNFADSLRIRRAAADPLRQLPRDALTALAAVILMLYLHNYLLKVTQGVDAANVWIWHFIVPPVVVLLAIDGISHWRRQAD